METHVTNSQKVIVIRKRQVVALVEAVLRLEGQSCNEIGIHFVSLKKISSLHQTHFNDPSPTDCISFPMDESDSDYRILGDVFVCPQVAVDYAMAKQKEPYEEASLYVLHGLLHLMGYDDMNVDDRKKMRAAERLHMKNLKKLNLLLKG